MKWLVYMVLAIGVLVACPGCRKDGKRSDKDDRQSEEDGKQAKETDEPFGRYEATSEFTMDMRRPQANDDPAELMERTFNVRKPGWRSDEIFTEVIQVYRGWRPTSQVTGKELATTLAKSKLELVPHLRLVRITVRSDSPELAADLANAYAEAIESFTDEENRKRCEKAVAQIHEQVERQKHADDNLAARLREFRIKNKIDGDGPKDMQVEADLKQLEQEKKVSSEIYQDLLVQENEQRIVAEQNNEIIRVVRRAQVPTKPDDEQTRLYEATSEFTMDTRRPQRGNGAGVVGTGMDFGADYAEIFNTRKSDWRSEGIFTKIIQQYKAKFPNSQVTEKELTDMLLSSELELVRHSRLITIAIRSKTPELAAALANSYAEAIEAFTDEENKKRCDKAVAQIHEQVMRQKLKDDDLARKLLNFRTEHKIDSLEAERTTFNQRLQTTTADVLEYEKRVTAAREWMNVLETAKNNPAKFGELPSDVPRSADIAAAYAKLQSVKAELAKMGGLTKTHPQVQAKEKELEALTSEFNASVSCAHATAVADLTANQNQLAAFKRKSEELKKRIDAVGLQIVRADVGLKKLEQERKVSSEIYQDLLMQENEQRIAAEQNNAIIRVVRRAQVPTKPVGR